MDYDELFPGRFLRASDLRGATTLTITGVTIEELPQEKGADLERGIVHFAQTPKGLVLNKTNGEAVKAMFGRDVGQWIGRKVAFAPESVKLGRETVPAIRVKGSPELDGPLTFTLKLSRKKPRDVTLTKTQQATRSTADTQNDAATSDGGTDASSDFWDGDGPAA